MYVTDASPLWIEVNRSPQSISLLEFPFNAKCVVTVCCTGRHVITLSGDLLCLSLARPISTLASQQNSFIFSKADIFSQKLYQRFLFLHSSETVKEGCACFLQIRYKNPLKQSTLCSALVFKKRMDNLDQFRSVSAFSHLEAKQMALKLCFIASTETLDKNCGHSALSSLD